MSCVVERNCERGFTLIEMLVGLVVTAMVMGALLAATKAVGLRWAGHEAFEQRSQRDNAVMAFVRREIAQLTPLAVIEERRRRPVFEGTPGSVAFVAPLPIHRALGGLYRLRFEVREDAEGHRLVLRFQRWERDADASLHADASWSEELLLEQLAFARFEFLEDDPKASWVDTWTSPNRYPKRIALRYRLAKQPLDEQRAVFTIHATEPVDRVATRIEPAAGSRPDVRADASAVSAGLLQ